MVMISQSLLFELVFEHELIKGNEATPSDDHELSLMHFEVDFLMSVVDNIS